MAEVPQITKDLAQKFFALLLRHRAYFQGLVQELGLSPPHVLVIQHLSDGALTMRELSVRTVCEPSHLTGLVDKLEERKLVIRKVDPNDRRSKLVSLTRTGRTFRDKLMARMGAPVPWMFTLSEADQAQLLSIIERVLAQTDGKL
ncbi:MAG TPA: MarR family transcriptional regulator [Pseudomonadota bacterium]|jgi:DNA-binding MarR family transcriptional regulator|nr:MarR family transcriptional regulator [Pseudomonadota bacterium]HNK44907.1 MarR family transcriptional regulator [Pseudomonadota bacterium]HNN50897.1 MarR family transcriptional regulator [Pseudomonadota bacterium]